MCPITKKKYKKDSHDKNLSIVDAAHIEDRVYPAQLRVSLSGETAQKARALFNESDYESEPDFERDVFNAGLDHIKENNKHFRN